MKSLYPGNTAVGAFLLLQLLSNAWAFSHAGQYGQEQAMASPRLWIRLFATGADKYVKEMGKRETRMLANWPPTSVRKLGDFGYYNSKKREFSRQGNIFTDNVVSKELDKKLPPSTTPERFILSSSASVSDWKAAGEVPVDQVGLATVGSKFNISFDASFSFAFAAVKLETEELDQVREIGKRLEDLYNAGEWDRKYKVITKVTNAAQVALATSESKGSTVSLGVTAQTAGLGGLVGFSYGTRTQGVDIFNPNDGTSILNHTPFFVMHRLKKKSFLGGIAGFRKKTIKKISIFAAASVDSAAFGDADDEADDDEFLSFGVNDRD